MAVTSVGTTTTPPSTTSTSTSTASSSASAGTSSSSGTLSAAGVGSGLDVKGLVSQLMAAEQRPLGLLTRQEISLQAKLSNLGTVKSSLASLQSAGQALSAASVTSYTATSSDTTFLTASATTEASVGNHSISVTQLAQAQKLVAAGKTDTAAALGSGTTTTLTFTLGTITGTPASETGIYPSGTGFAANPDKTSISITIDSSNNTLTGIAAAINASGAGVTASIVNDGSSAPYRLVLTPTDSGSANSMKIEVAGDSTLQSLLAYDASTVTQNLEQVLAAQDAKLTVDGVRITSATNAVSDAVPGVTLNLTKKTGDTPVTIGLQRDTSGLSSALSALVKAYNDTNSTINGVSAKGASLQGDWTVLGLQTQIRAIFGGSQSAGTYSTLSQLGVRFQKDGTLSLDTSKLSAALSSNPDAVGTLTLAVGRSLETATEQMLGTNGAIASKTNGINSSVKSLGTRRSEMQHRLEGIQKRYEAQFSALDTLLSSMSKTSSFLTQQLDNLPKLGTYA